MILKTLISMHRCVWLRLELNSAGKVDLVSQIWGSLANMKQQVLKRSLLVWAIPVQLTIRKELDWQAIWPIRTRILCATADICHLAWHLRPVSIDIRGCIRKLRQLTCCLADLWGNDFAGSVFARRHLTKLISERLLRQRNGLMIYNKIDRVLVITKLIFNHYNTKFSLEITSKVQNVIQKYTFTHKLTTKRNF